MSDDWGPEGGVDLDGLSVEDGLLGKRGEDLTGDVSGLVTGLVVGLVTGLVVGCVSDGWSEEVVVDVLDWCVGMKVDEEEGVVEVDEEGVEVMEDDVELQLDVEFVVVVVVEAELTTRKDADPVFTKVGGVVDVDDRPKEVVDTEGIELECSPALSEALTDFTGSLTTASYGSSLSITSCLHGCCSLSGSGWMEGVGLRFLGVPVAGWLIISFTRWRLSNKSRR